MGIIGNIECCAEDAGYWLCDCPHCRVLKVKGAEKNSPSVKLTRKESGLILSVLDNYVIECDNRSDRKNIDSPEWLALQRLARDVEGVAVKIREAGR